MKRIYLLLALLPLFLITACDDDDLQPRPGETPLETLNRLVPATQTGAGTFGCLVNGEVWIPEVDGPDSAIDALTGITNPNNLTITARKEPLSDNRNHNLVIGSVFEVEQPSPMKLFSKFRDRDVNDNCSAILLDTTFLNFITISKHDQENQIISGTFECTMQEPECPEKTIEITEGRFDLIYRF